MPIVSSINRDLELSDVGTRIRVSSTNSTPMKVFVRQEGSVAYPAGFWVEVVNVGANSPGQVSIEAEFGVTVNALSGTMSIELGEYGRLVKVSGVSDTWDLHVFKTIPTTGTANQVLTSSGSSGSTYWSDKDPTPPLRIMNAGATAFDIGSAYDHHTMYRCDSPTPQVLTVLADASWPDADPYYGSFANTSPMPDGGTILIGKRGLGDVTIAAAPGVTINTPSTLTISVQNGKISLTKVGPDEWDVEGNLAAV